MSAAVSNPLLTAEVRVQSLASLSKIIAREGATGTGLPSSSLVFSCPSIIPTVLSFVTNTIIILPNESFVKTDLKIKNTLGENVF